MNNQYIERYAIETAKHDASRLTLETGIEHTVKEIDEGVFIAAPVDCIPEPPAYFDEPFLVGEPIPHEVRNKPTPRSSYNAVLDNETPYSTVDLLKHIDDDQLIKRLSKTLANGIQLPQSTTFLMGLAIFSSIATRKYSVAYEYGGSIPIGLYVVAEQPPAAAKTWLQGEFQKPFDDVDDEKRGLHKAELKQLKSIKKEELTDAERERLDELKANHVPLLFITNTTPEGLEMSLHKTGGFFSLVSSEQSLFDSLLGLYQGDASKQNNNEVVLNGFDGGKSGTLRIGREAYSGRATGSVALFAQNGSIEKVLNASNGTGLSERFLMLSEPSLLGKRDHINVPRIDRSTTAEYEKICVELARLALDKENEVGMLSISKNGHFKIKEYRNQIEQHLADGGKYAVHKSLRGGAGKANMQVMKIAANLHLLDGGTYQGEIDDRHVTSAIGITQDLLEAALGLCHDKGLVGTKAEWQAIIGYLSNKRGLKSAEIVEGVRNKKPFKDMTGKKPNAIRTAILEMTQQGLLTELNGVYSVS